jgi:uncharacterized GH25 family protein
MKRHALLAVALLTTAAGSLLAHDMFLKLETFFLAENATVAIQLINGTFDKSENSITRDRMADVSVVMGDMHVMKPSESAWHDHPRSAWLEFETGAAGTYVVGVSSNPTVFELSGEDFDGYLEHDGVVDVLEKRKAEGTFGQSAVERYSKHVKAIVQVGEARTDAFEHALGYPVEFIPLQNPYEMGVGDTFQVLFLKYGEPVANQIIYASHEAYHGHAEGGGHIEAVTTRTDGEGVASFRLSAEGKWYVRTINMIEPGDGETDYESNWATLTFEIQ